MTTSVVNKERTFPMSYAQLWFSYITFIGLTAGVTTIKTRASQQSVAATFA